MEEARYNETLERKQGLSETGPLSMTDYVGTGFTQHSMTPSPRSTSPAHYKYFRPLARVALFLSA
jgi:hypothetical protein